MKITKTFPRIGLSVVLSLTFFLLPINLVYADTYSDDSTYWRWWYVEQITDEMTDGNGVNVENIDDTYNGSTAGEYIYNSTGITADDVKEYVKNQYDNAVGYVDKSYEQYSNMIDDIWNSSIDVATKASYQAQKALRKTVDTAGHAVYNVSSSSYWGNVYNDLFNNGSYKNQYEQTSDNSYAVSVNGKNYNISLAGFGYAYGDLDSVVTNGYSNFNQGLSNEDLSNKYFVFSVTGNGSTVYVNCDKGFYIDQSFVVESAYNFQFGYKANYTVCTFNFLGSNHSTVWDNSVSVYFSNNISDGQSGGTPVLQPKQVGYVIHNGISYPVYSDPSLNPFTINDDGTVTWNDGTGTEPIFVDPSQLTDDGWLNILENIDNSDNTENPYNPFGRPWNTQDDGSALGGFFGNLIKDIGSVFKGLADTLSSLFKNLIDGILNALKSLFDIDFNSIASIELDVNFNIINQIWQKLLEILGVS